MRSQQQRKPDFNREPEVDNAFMIIIRIKIKISHNKDLTRLVAKAESSGVTDFDNNAFRSIFMCNILFYRYTKCLLIL